MATKKFKGDRYYDAIVDYMRGHAITGNAEQTHYSGEQWTCPDKGLYELDETWQLRGVEVAIHRSQFAQITVDTENEEVLQELEKAALTADSVADE
ncbi:hypothetical protein GF371_02160 [Candidatus Woesearchaeota archaeon]|nr:hypothetical protein [Candidatus Woesearchaeota archaeon]